MKTDIVATLFAASTATARTASSLVDPHAWSHPVETPPVHVPLAQVCPERHARPQLPQFVAFSRVLVSHPLPALPSQSAKPPLHR
jgi:hypothetical protein